MNKIDIVACTDNVFVMPTGVMMFFAMTGFVIMPAYERSVQKENALRVFYWNILIRLYPALWASFILITLVNACIIGVNIFRPVI